MKFPSHAVASLAIFALLITVGMSIYNGMVDNYNIVEDDIQPVALYGNETMTIGEAMQKLTIVESINGITNDITAIQPGSASLIDIVGGLISVAVGLLKSVVGLLIIPYQMGEIITTFYGATIAQGIVSGVILMIVVYGAFMLLGYYLQRRT